MIAGVPDAWSDVSEGGPIVGAADGVTAPTSAMLPGVSMAGYARVSTDHQSLDAQRDALRVQRLVISTDPGIPRHRHAGQHRRSRRGDSVRRADYRTTF